MKGFIDINPDAPEDINFELEDRVIVDSLFIDFKEYLFASSIFAHSISCTVIERVELLTLYLQQFKGQKLPLSKRF